MVLHAIALVFLPFVAAGMMYPQQQVMMMVPQQKNWGQSYGVQMTGMVQPQTGGQMQIQGSQQQSNNQWYAMTNSEEYEAYLKWCEERKLALEQQQQQQELLKQIEAKAQEAKRAEEREKAAKEMQMKRESMAAQMRMFQSQLEMSKEVKGMMDKFEEMRGLYMFKLTTEFLKFCKCSDYAAHLSQYLRYGSEVYTPSTGAELFMLEGTGLEGIDTSSVEAVAQRMVAMNTTDQVRVFYGGVIGAMCDSVNTYTEKIVAMEAQYNFMGQ